MASFPSNSGLSEEKLNKLIDEFQTQTGLPREDLHKFAHLLADAWKKEDEAATTRGHRPIQNEPCPDNPKECWSIRCQLGNKCKRQQDAEREIL